MPNLDFYTTTALSHAGKTVDHVVYRGNIVWNTPVTLPSVVNNPSVATNLATLDDNGAQPFINVFKTAKKWVGRSGNTDVATFEDMLASGHLTEQGWPRSIPSNCNRIATSVLAGIDPSATIFAGRYRIMWTGDGSVTLSGVSNIVTGSNQIDFDFWPGFASSIDFYLTGLNVNNPFRDVVIAKHDMLASHNAGQVFHPLWLESIRNYRMLRFVDWQYTNFSRQSEWSNRPLSTDAMYTRRGVSVETMVQLCNLVGADPWFCMPHLATNEYVQSFATYARDNLFTKLVSKYEYSNEMSNPAFGGAYGQYSWAANQASIVWPGQSSGPAQWYAGQAVNMAELLDQVYSTVPSRYKKVIATNTFTQGYETAVLNAPNWMASNPTKNAPHTYFDEYAVSGNVEGSINSDANIANIKNANNAQLRDQLITGGWTNTQNTVDSLSLTWAYHAGVCTTNNLQLVMYSGGCNIRPTPTMLADNVLMEKLKSFVYSPEMGQVYQELISDWNSISNYPFNASAETLTSTKGFFGLNRYLGDNNQRSIAVARYNATVSGMTGRNTDAFLGTISVEGGNGSTGPVVTAYPRTASMATDSLLLAGHSFAVTPYGTVDNAGTPDPFGGILSSAWSGPIATDYVPNAFMRNIWELNGNLRNSNYDQVVLSEMTFDFANGFPSPSTSAGIDCLQHMYYAAQQASLRNAEVVLADVWSPQGSDLSPNSQGFFQYCREWLQSHTGTQVWIIPLGPFVMAMRAQFGNVIYEDGLHLGRTSRYARATSYLYYSFFTQQRCPFVVAGDEDLDTLAWNTLLAYECAGMGGSIEYVAPTVADPLPSPQSISSNNWIDGNNWIDSNNWSE